MRPNVIAIQPAQSPSHANGAPRKSVNASASHAAPREALSSATLMLASIA